MSFRIPSMTFWKSPVIMTVLSLEHRFIGAAPVAQSHPYGPGVYADLNGNGDRFRLKPAAVVSSARRSGTTATWDQLNKYFGLMQMPIVTSRYWNMVHGMTPEEVKKDLEGMQVMRVLGRNMAFFINCKHIALKMGISLPKKEEFVFTNFIAKDEY